MDTLLKLMLVTCVTALVALLGWILFIAVDSIGVEPEPQSATIIARNFTPAHTTTSLIMVGKVMVPQTHYHPDAWSIAVRFDGGTVWCPATQQQYDSARENQNVVAIIKAGRLSGDAYCNGIR